MVASIDVRHVVAHVTHLQEMVAIVRSAAAEVANRLSGLGNALPELVAQRDGCGVRPATVETIMAAESALDALATDLKARRLATLSVSIEGTRTVEVSRPVPGFGADHVVRRDLLELAHRPPKRRPAR